MGLLSRACEGSGQLHLELAAHHDGTFILDTGLEMEFWSEQVSRQDTISLSFFQAAEKLQVEQPYICYHAC